MTGSRILFVCLLASLLLLGCTTPVTPPENVTPNVTPPANQTNVTPPPVPPPPPPPPPPLNQTNVTPPSCTWPAPLPDLQDYGMLRYNTESTVEAVAISDFGYRAVAGSADYSIYYFKKGEAQPFYTYKTGNQVNSVDMSISGVNYVAGSWDGRVYYFDCDNSSPAWKYDTKQDNEEATVRRVAITKTGIWSTAITETRLYIFNNSENGKAKFKIDLGVPDYQLESIAISDDGSRVVVGTSNNGLNSKVFLYDAKTGQKIWENSITDLRWADNVPVPVAISSDGSVIAAGGSDNNIRLWTGSQSTPSWKYKIANESFVYSVSLSDDGKKLAVTGDFKLFYFADTSIGTPTWINDGTYFDDNNESRTGNWGIGNKLNAVDLSPDGSRIAAIDYVYGHLFVFKDGKNESMKMYDLASEVDGVQSVGISPDGSWVIAGSTSYGEILRFKAG